LAPPNSLLEIGGYFFAFAEGFRHFPPRLDSSHRAYFLASVGTNLIALRETEEIQRGRLGTLEALQEIFKKKGSTPIEIIGHYGCKMTEEQVFELRKWLMSLKTRV
jgi:hypothetical protein